MRYAVWTAVIAASAAVAATATAGNFTLLPPPEVHPYFSNGLSPPGRERCDFPQPCWDKLQDSPVVVLAPAKPIVRKAH
jgi:hypothetical protein